MQVIQLGELLLGVATSNPCGVHLISIAISYYYNQRGKLCPIQRIQKNNQ